MRWIVTVCLAFLVAGCSGPGDVKPISPRSSSAMGDSFYATERERSERYPYANDLEPATLDISGYPPEMQKLYNEVISVKCARCHTLARVINSEFVQPTGDDAEKDRKLKDWQAKNPELFFENNVWRIAGNSWDRSVRRMMAKPGSEVSPAEARAIAEFLAYDSEQRKVGPKAPAWATHRRKLLEDFRKQHPQQSRLLYGN